MSNSNNKNDKVKIITPPNDIKRKVGSGGIDPANIKKAKKTIQESTKIFPEIVEKELGLIKKALTAIQANKMGTEEFRYVINAASFEIKSSAAMFEYVLMGDVAVSLYEYSHTITYINDKVIEVIDLHYQAMRAAMALRDQNADINEAHKMVTGLMAVAKKSMEQN